MHDRYFLTAQVSAVTDAAATIQIVRSGLVQSIYLELVCDFDADIEGASVEISRQNTYQGQSNNARGILAILSNNLNLTTSGGANGGCRHAFDLDEPVAALDFLYMNFGGALAGAGTFPGEAIARAIIQVATTGR